MVIRYILAETFVDNSRFDDTINSMSLTLRIRL